MPSINKTLGNVKAMMRKIDTLTVEVNVGDYWTTHSELEELSKGTPQAKIVNALATGMRPLSLSKKADKATILRIKNNLQAIIDWLGSLEAQR